MTTKIVICVYIDNLLIFGPKLSDIATLKSEVTKTVDITDLGEISYFLGIKITRDR